MQECIERRIASPLKRRPQVYAQQAHSLVRGGLAETCVWADESLVRTAHPTGGCTCRGRGFSRDLCLAR
jgi:hypothetical protein